MMRTIRFAALVAAALWALAALQPATAKEKQGLALDTINSANFSPDWRRDEPLLIKLQVLLDRAHFSPGVIDGHSGMNTRRALRAYQQAHGLNPTGQLDEETWDRLGGNNAQDVVKDYDISKADVAGPFIKHIPKGFAAMSKLKALSYTSPAELLAERFQMDTRLLKQLNGGADFEKAGTTILVTNVRDVNHPPFKVARIEVRKADQSVVALGRDGNVLAYYPATIGSTDMPSPSGTMKVKGVAKNPDYKYNPKKLHFPGVKLKHSVTIAPGPNNPVGLEWIALTKPGYGIHGSPDPSAVRRQASHGCVRLTNWDAIELGDATKPGIKVQFVG